MDIHLAEDGGSERIEDVSYDAIGCAMSRASASIMADLLIGHDVAEVEPARLHFQEAIGSRGRVEGDEELIGDGVHLAPYANAATAPCLRRRTGSHRRDPAAHAPGTPG